MERAIFAKRLAETIAWCSLQQIDNDPVESEEFRRRQQLESQARELLERARSLEERSLVHRVLSKHLHLDGCDDPDKMRRDATELSRTADIASILPLKKQLRSSELSPRSFALPENDRFEIVEELCIKRASLLSQRNAYRGIRAFDLSGGKLLAYTPDENVSDGASQYVSKGHFDLEDAPPWDTWVVYASRYLISWVPPELFALVSKGIAVNAVDCIRWADDAFIEALISSVSSSHK